MAHSVQELPDLAILGVIKQKMYCGLPFEDCEMLLIKKTKNMGK